MTSPAAPRLLPTATAAPGTAWSSQRPEPGRFWIRYRPRHWPAPEHRWSDLGVAVLRDAEAGPVPRSLPADLDPPPAGSIADVVYLPPVAAPLEAQRLALARRITEKGSPVILHCPLRRLGGDGGAPGAAVGADLVAVYDPLPLLLATGWRRTLEELSALAPPAGAVLVWPLVAGYSDEDPSSAAEALSATRFAAVQPLTLDLAPAQRRELAAEQEAAVYDALFHRPPPGEGVWVRALGRLGAPPPLFSRPLPVGPPAGNRRIAGALALTAELWLRVGRSPVSGQALYRAARWADGSGRDLSALAREGNLGVLPAFDDRARRIASEAAAVDGYPSLTRELLDEYRSVPPTDGPEEAQEPGRGA